METVHVDGQKSHNCQDVSSSPLDLWFQCIPNQSPSMLFYGYRQTHSKVYVERKQHRTATSVLKDTAGDRHSSTSRLTIKLQESRQRGPGERPDKLNFIKLKTMLSERQCREWEDKPRTGRKYLQQILVSAKGLLPKIYKKKVLKSSLGKMWLS